MLSNQAEGQYDARRAAYDLKKLRGKKIVHRIGQTRRYQSTSSGLKAMIALVVLRNKAIKPLLAAVLDLHHHAAPRKTPRIVSTNSSGVNGFRRHARKSASCVRVPSVCEKKALIAITGTLPPLPCQNPEFHAAIRTRPYPAFLCRTIPATIDFKRRVRASQHFRSFWGARRTIAGYEAIHMIRKAKRAAVSVYCTTSFSVYSRRRTKMPIIYPDLRLDYKVATHPSGAHWCRYGRCQDGVVGWNCWRGRGSWINGMSAADKLQERISSVNSSGYGDRNGGSPASSPPAE